MTNEKDTKNDLTEELEEVYIAILYNGMTIAGIPTETDGVWKNPVIVGVTTGGNIRLDLLTQFNRELERVNINTEGILITYPAEKQFRDLYKEHMQKVQAQKAGITMPDGKTNPRGGRGSPRGG